MTTKRNSFVTVVPGAPRATVTLARRFAKAVGLPFIPTSLRKFASGNSQPRINKESRDYLNCTAIVFDLVTTELNSFAAALYQQLNCLNCEIVTVVPFFSAGTQEKAVVEDHNDIPYAQVLIDQWRAAAGRRARLYMVDPHDICIVDFDPGIVSLGVSSPGAERLQAMTERPTLVVAADNGRKDMAIEVMEKLGGDTMLLLLDQRRDFGTKTLVTQLSDDPELEDRPWVVPEDILRSGRTGGNVAMVLKRLTGRHGMLLVTHLQGTIRLSDMAEFKDAQFERILTYDTAPTHQRTARRLRAMGFEVEVTSIVPYLVDRLREFGVIP